MTLSIRVRISASSSLVSLLTQELIGMLLVKRNWNIDAYLQTIDMRRIDNPSSGGNAHRSPQNLPNPPPRVRPRAHGFGDSRRASAGRVPTLKPASNPVLSQSPSGPQPFKKSAEPDRMHRMDLKVPHRPPRRGLHCETLRPRDRGSGLSDAKTQSRARVGAKGRETKTDVHRLIYLPRAALN